MKPTTLFVKILMIWVTMSSQAAFAQQSSGEKLIRGYYAAYEAKDWGMLESILADGFTFSSPVDEHISLKEYKEKCWPNSASIKKFDVVKLIVKGDEGYVTYNGWTTDGRLFRNTEYFTFKDGKIKTNECFFGPGVHYPNNTGK
jgi:hypothetical protein